MGYVSSCKPLSTKGGHRRLFGNQYHLPTVCFCRPRNGYSAEDYAISRNYHSPATLFRVSLLDTVRMGTPHEIRLEGSDPVPSDGLVLPTIVDSSNLRLQHMVLVYWHTLG